MIQLPLSMTGVLSCIDIGLQLCCRNQKGQVVCQFQLKNVFKYMHICGIRNSDCWQVCCSISLICHPSRASANEALLIVWSSAWLLTLSWIQCDDLLNFQIRKSLCLKVQIQTWNKQMYLVGMSSIWKRSEVGQVCQNSCLQIFKRFVLWVVEYLMILTDTWRVLAKPPFTFRIPLLIDSVGNHWFRKLALFLIHSLCLFFFFFTFR